MKTCHVCLCECEDYAELCPVCGADLTGVENSETENVIDRVIEKPVLLATLEDVGILTTLHVDEIRSIISFVLSTQQIIL